MGGNKSGLNMLAHILLIIGGLNWLLVGLVQWDIGALFGGMDNIISRIIYILVGLAAIYAIFGFKHSSGGSSSSGSSMPQGGGQ